MSKVLLLLRSIVHWGGEGAGGGAVGRFPGAPWGLKVIHYREVFLDNRHFHPKAKPSPTEDLGLHLRVVAKGQLI